MSDHETQKGPTWTYRDGEWWLPLSETEWVAERAIREKRLVERAAWVVGDSPLPSDVLAPPPLSPPGEGER